MSRIESAADAAGINWRALVRATQTTPGLRAAVGDAIFTRAGYRDPTGRALIAVGRELSEEAAPAEDKIRRRQMGVNQLSGRVNGRWVDRGQPRGQREGRRS